MKKLNRLTVKIMFENAVDGGSSNAFRYILPYVNTYASMAGNGNADCISLVDLQAVLKQLSAKWEKEIDKATA